MLRGEIFAQTEPMGTHHAADWLSRRVVALGGRRLAWPGCDAVPALAPAPGTLAPMFERAQCALWWRRQLRRAVVTLRELEAMHRGEVSRRGDLYCTDDTVARRKERTAANRAMLEQTQIEDEAGEVITLAQAADASTSNKAIRRGELMTRIKGCEQWAEAHEMAGLFTTHSAPSRFHPQLWNADARHPGGHNPKHDGSHGPMQPNGVKDCQQWHRLQWSRCRAALARAGVTFYGFRVAEPHHDGTPHWHMLLWAHSDDIELLTAIMRAAWLSESPDQAGAQEHRFKAVEMRQGGAAGYIAKYIAKNIDDAGAVGTEGHIDTDEQGQTDHVGTGKAQRVEAWAAAHGIRQFQALGQPPVTVWRELRRVQAAALVGAHADVKAAHAAVNRDGEQRAAWRGYLAAQGGPMQGRVHRISIARSTEPTAAGRYGEAMAARILGVQHYLQTGFVVCSQRREWKPAGTWARTAPAPVVPDRVEGFGWGLRAFDVALDLPRTRVNNCTDKPAKPAPKPERKGMTEAEIDAFWQRLGEARPPPPGRQPGA